MISLRSTSRPILGNAHPKLPHITPHPALSRLGEIQHRMFMLVFRRAQEMHIGRDGRVNHPAGRRRKISATDLDT